MRHVFCLSALLLATTPAIAHAGDVAALVGEVKPVLEKAKATEDPFIIDAVRSAAVKQYPDLAQWIDRYLAGEDEASGESGAEAEVAANAHQWSGEAEAGINISTGNTEEEHADAKVRLDHEKGKWHNTLKLKAYGSKENGVRTGEDYRSEFKSRYALTEKDYVFGDLEYVNDRFGGFESRLSETVGYGRKLYDTEKFKLDAEAGIGARQTSYTNGTDENTLLQTLGANAEWEITEGIDFREELKMSFGEDTTVTESETSLKTTLYKNLYLKFGVDVEHVSDVPPGTENTDVVTTLNVGYSFGD